MSCPACGGSGFVLDERTRTARDCECRAARRTRVRARTAGRAVPERWRGASLERLPAAELDPVGLEVVRRLLDDLDARLDAGASLWLHDLEPPAAGGEDRALRLAAVVAATAWRAGRVVGTWRLGELCGLPGRRLAEVREADLLVLHGLHERVDEGRALEVLGTVLSHRHAWLRSTLLAGRGPLDEAPAAPPVRERLVAACGDPVLV